VTVNSLRTIVANHSEGFDLRGGLSWFKESQGSIGVLDTSLITVFTGLILAGSTIDEEDWANVIERAGD
tara:strand:+ start:1531 stop:1737 length:207 start_codon:yes stop_codon:yes gene_type:complete